MSHSIMQPSCAVRQTAVHAVHPAAFRGNKVRPFERHRGPRIARPLHRHSRTSTIVQAKDIEIVIKADEGDQPLRETWSVEEDVELHSMPFSKPLGAVLAEQKGRIVVEKIVDGSNAALGGLQLGDVIRGTTARSQIDAKPTRAGSGSRAKQDYWGAQILVNADGQSFDTVMAALNSSRCQTCDVTLIVERKKGAENKASPQSPQSPVTASSQ